MLEAARIVSRYHYEADGVVPEGAVFEQEVPAAEQRELLVSILTSRHPHKGLALLKKAGFVAAVTPFATESMKEWATLLLPIGTFAETSGTFVNAEGRWQSWPGCIRPLGEARPGWKVLRVLGNLLGLDGFDYDSSEEVREELRGLLTPVAAAPVTREIGVTAVRRQREVPVYGSDALVRRSTPLQQTSLARAAAG